MALLSVCCIKGERFCSGGGVGRCDSGNRVRRAFELGAVVGSLGCRVQASKGIVCCVFGCGSEMVGHRDERLYIKGT